MLFEQGHFPVDTGCKLNVLCTFNLRPVSTGLYSQYLALDTVSSKYLRSPLNLKQLFSSSAVSMLLPIIFSFSTNVVLLS